MDIKTCELVLRKLMVMLPRPNLSAYVMHDKIKESFGLEESQFIAAVVKLHDMRLVKKQLGNDRVVIFILPAAFGYFPAKEEAEQKETAKKWDDRRWDLIKGFGIGVAATLVSQFLLKAISGYISSP